MKKIKEITIIIFAIILLLPLLNFNFEKDAVSAIDNRNLAGNPFTEYKNSKDVKFSTLLDNYVSDRIGFRNKLIRTATVLNDKVFGIMDHPSYTYGKDGYIFGAGIYVDEEYSQYHKDFVEAVAKMQEYCEERDVPFVFVFEPAKPAVLKEYIADGINYDGKWIDEFISALDEKGINYVDNTDMLKEKTKEGEMVFNKKFDANHWNSLGAYYGVNAVLERLKPLLPSVHINTMDEMDVSTKTEKSLLVSEFPIDEKTPVITPKHEADYSVTNLYYDELERDDQYKTFWYYKNKEREEEGAPKALVFQGSYMNEYGYNFFANAFSDYIYIHDYQNVFDMDYYFNIFKPDCVIFELAEYTFDNVYFDNEKMNDMKLNRPLKDSWEEYEGNVEEGIDKDHIKVEKGKTLTKITWITDNEYDSVWAYAGEEFDMRKCDKGYEFTLHTSDYEKNKDDLIVINMENDSVKAHKVSK